MRIDKLGFNFYQARRSEISINGISQIGFAPLRPFDRRMSKLKLASKPFQLSPWFNQPLPGLKVHFLSYSNRWWLTRCTRLWGAKGLSPRLVAQRFKFSAKQARHYTQTATAFASVCSGAEFFPLSALSTSISSRTLSAAHLGVLPTCSSLASTGPTQPGQPNEHSHSLTN